MKRTFASIFRKEMIHIFRDVQSLFMVLTMPILMLLLYGYAITLDMKGIDIAIIDQSHSPESRSLVEHISSTDFFRITARDVPVDSVSRLFNSRTVRCVLVIPQDYARELVAAPGPQVQLLVDASDPNAANFINNYVGRVISEENVRLSGHSPVLFNVSPRIFYNPDMRSADFFVPGLIGLILILISSLLTSIAIVREKETGTMEQLLVSPIKPLQLILGKVLPYTMLGFIDGVLILVVGSLWFNVPITGSLVLVLTMMLIYVVTGISLGILVSTLAKNQAIAMLAAVMLTILPTVMMSGFIFPIASMPKALQYVAAIVPATYFMEIIRGIVLKGNTLANLYQPAGILLAMDVLLIVLATRLFRVRLE
ncbi:MAG TPA: ABC transporter permease [Spirochaetia bacterium]|nr:ABC transporter permease [Spirochaetia bacterium]